MPTFPDLIQVKSCSPNENLWIAEADFQGFKPPISVKEQKDKSQIVQKKPV